jgi:hypothetical protein
LARPRRAQARGGPWARPGALGTTLSKRGAFGRSQEARRTSPLSEVVAAPGDKPACQCVRCCPACGLRQRRAGGVTPA